MKTLKGTLINLRPLEPEDLQFLYDTENDESSWKVSGTQVPYSKHILKNYIENSHQDIYEAKQARFVIESKELSIPIGMIDLFDFDPIHKRAGIGILVVEKFQNKGFASEALKMIISYGFHYLNLHQLYANITTDNRESIHLFEKLKFQLIGIKKDWRYYDQKFYDEAIYQLIHSISGSNA
jgi:diamine N-acetyltransferase